MQSERVGKEKQFNSVELQDYAQSLGELNIQQGSDGKVFPAGHSNLNIYFNY